MIVVSPAKKLNMEPVEDMLPTEPVFAEQACEIEPEENRLGRGGTGGTRLDASGARAPGREPNGP